MQIISNDMLSQTEDVKDVDNTVVELCAAQQTMFIVICGTSDGYFSFEWCVNRGSLMTYWSLSR